MSFKLLGGGSDVPTIVNDINQNILELKNREVTDFFKDDTGTRRVLLGKGANGFYGLKVSPENVDVFTARDDQLIFNSGQDIFKIIKTGLVNFPVTAANVSIGGQESSAVDVDTGVSSDVPFIVFCFNYAVESAAIQLDYYALTPSSTDFGGLIAYAFQQSPYADVVTGTVHIGIESTNYLNGSLPASTIKWYLLQEAATTVS